MAKQLNVNLGFTADTSQAKAQIQQLQRDLKNLTSSAIMQSSEFELTKDLQEATAAAAQLSVQLKNATNVNTGNLDLTRFNESLKASGMSLEKYQDQLYQLGPAGEKAFADLARSITLAEVPMRRSSQLLDNLWTTMKNTARWQLTSSAMHGFMGAVSSAYGYVQDLNESLNNIRIVTNASIDDMGRFASEANRAAKALSTTTTEYTNASLIYYQQGLSDEEVKKRTDITIKMANAAGESAEKVSDQLTAVWNNFYDGTKSLEHYADVMTALGAKTASSTDEIAGGLEKFAAVADTIGLSYEYAASALATITSNTRESEEVVGTALKTLFSRIQGLQLGETLEDGVDLNKYSEALATVGINILDTNGELKKMDIILDEMGSKWDTLSKSQQVALAETVAGVRQYNQLVALMDNWDSGDSDSFQANLFTANNATGALQEQADIYAESWEAANNRVRASAEAVYSALLNDEFFINLTNNFGKLLDGVKSFIDGLGGVKGVLLAIGGIVTRVFSKQIGESLSNMAYSLKATFNPKGVMQEQLAEKKRVNELLISGAKDSGTTAGGFRAEAYTALGQNQLDYIVNVEKMSQEEQAVNQILMDRNRQLAEEVMRKGEVVEAIEKEIKAEKTSLQISAQYAAGKDGSDQAKSAVAAVKLLSSQYEKVTINAAKLQNVSDKLNLDKKFITSTQEAQKLNEEVKETVIQIANIEVSDSESVAIDKLSASFGIAANEAKELWEALNNPDTTSLDTLNDKLIKVMISSDQAAQEVRGELMLALQKTGMSSKEATTQMKAFDMALEKYGPASAEAEAELRKLTKTINEQGQSWEKASVKPIQFGQALSQAASGIMAIGQLFTTLTGIIDVFNDSEATTGDKIMALVSGIGMLIPAVMSIIPAFSKATTTVTIFGTATSVAMWQVTLIVGAIAALATAIAIIATAESDVEKAAKKAAEAAEGLAERANEAKQALEDIKSAFDGYDSAVEVLNSCTKGTEEWRNALQEVNQQVLDIIAKNPDLAASMKISRDSDGRLVIENQDEIIKEATVRAEQSNFAMSMGNVTSAQADLKRNIQDFIQSDRAREFGLQERQEDDEGNFAGYKTTQEGRFVREYYAELSQSANAEDFKQQYGHLQELSGMSIAAFNNLIDNLYLPENNDILEGIRALGDQSFNTANQLEASANAIAAIKLVDYDIGSQEVGSEAYEVAYTKHYNDALSEGKSLGRTAGRTNQDVVDFWKRYSEATGTNFSLDKNAVQGNADNRFFAYVDQGVSKKISVEEAAAAIAATEALKEMGDAAKTATNILNDITIDENAGYTKEDLSNFWANGNFDNITENGILNLTQGMTWSGGKLIFDAAAEEAAAKAYGGQDNFNTIAAAKLGVTDLSVFDSTSTNYDAELEKKYIEMKDQMEKEFFEAATNSVNAFASVGKGLATPVKSWYDEHATWLQQFSVQGQKTIVNALSNAFNTVGSRGMEALADVFDMAGDQADELESILSNVDWSDPAAIEKLNAALKDQGITIDTSSEAWITYTTEMQAAGLGAQSVTTHIQTLRDTINELNGLLEGLEMGDIVDDETYERLIKMNPLVKEFFGMAADGYKMVGDPEQLKEILTPNFEDQIAEMKASYGKLREAGEYLTKAKDTMFDENTSDGELASLVHSLGGYSDTLLKQMGITSNEALQEASAYVSKFASVKDSLTGDQKATYEESLALLQDFQTKLQNIQQQYENGAFEDVMAEEVWASSLARGFKDLTDAAEKGAISWETYNKYLNQVLSADLSNLMEIQDALSAGSELSEEQSKYLDDLEDQWEELDEIADRGSNEYLAALTVIEDAMQKIRLNQLINEAESVELNVNADIKTFEDQLDTILNRRREVIVQVVADTQDAYSDFDNLASRMSSAAAAIGEDFLVSRDNIAAVAEAFPGILEAATVTSTGMIKLDTVNAQSAVNAAAIEMEAAQGTLTAELQAERDKLDARITTNNATIALLQNKLLTSTTLTSEEMAILKQYDAGLTDFRSDQMEIQLGDKETAATEEQTLSNETAAAEETNAVKSSQAWATAFQDMVANAVTAANAMIASANAVGEANYRAGGGTGEYKGADSVTNPNLDWQVTTYEKDKPNGGGTGGPGGKPFLQQAGGVGRFDAQFAMMDADGNMYYPGQTTGLDTGTGKGKDIAPLTEVEKLLGQYNSATDDKTKSALEEKILEIIENIKKENTELAKAIGDIDASMLASDSWLQELQDRIKNAGTGEGGTTSSNNNGGDTGKDPKQLEMLKDTVDVYADIDTEIDNINEKLKDQKRITQHAETEEEKLKSLEEEAKILEELNEAYKEKQAIAKDTAADLKADLQQAVSNSDMGIQLEFDNDTLKNQVAIFTQLEAEVNAARQAVNTAVTEEQRQAAEEQLAAIEAASDEIRTLIQQYLETIALLQNVENAIADGEYEIQTTYAASQGTTNTSSSSSGSSSGGGGGGGDSGPSLEEIQQAYYAKISGLLEADMAQLERQLGRLDFQLERIADDFYSMAEAAELMTQKLPIALDSLEKYEDFYNQISEDYDNMNITSEDYQAGLEESYDGIMSQLEALVELDKEMMHYYEDTLAAGMDELAKYTDQMDHLNSVLDHYHSIITMINGEDEYKSIGIILEGKAHNLQNQMDIAVANYEMLLSQQAAIRAKYDAAEDEAQRELHKAELDAITATVDEAHETMLAKTEEWAEAQKSILENSMAQAAKQLENAFTNGMGFDTLSSSLGRLSSISDEYYTKTNQIYETQKMLNNLQQEIDKTTNTAAKARLKSYASEIEKLREKNKLSKLDLSIAKAKYDVLLAEIALEEAQNAKATVRLQRDSEGNYGYVYTADQNQIAQAEQKLADAQNALYNVSLEGANNYGQKILELQQQLADDLVSLEEARAAGQFQTDEAYYAAKEQLIAEYNELFEAYSDSYNVALMEDLSIQQEAWIMTYEDLIQESENWQEHVLEYTTNCENSYTHYREIIEANSEVIQNALNNIRDTVGDITTKSDDLADTVLNRVIPAMDKELTQVGKVTEAFAAQRSTIEGLIGYYQTLCNQIDTAISKAQQLNAEKAGEVEGDNPSGGNNTGPGSGTDITGKKNPLLKPRDNPEGDLKDGLKDGTEPGPTGKIKSNQDMIDLVLAISRGEYGNQNPDQRFNAVTGSGPKGGYTAEEYYKAQSYVNQAIANQGESYRKGTQPFLDEVTRLVNAGGFASGGYTGIWGPEGRLAFLHEKELILNKQDTANFLVATQVLRDIAQMIDMNSLHSQISNLTSIGMTPMKADTLEQQVSIEAHFPNVTDKNEIEQALNNLVNTAAQYANRKF